MENDDGRPGSEKRKILRRLNKARKGLFPEKTCPASRHVHMIVEGLLNTKDGYGGDMARLGYEPDHMAGSIASVLESLWTARRWMRWQLKVEGNLLSGGEWVPDLDAITAMMKAQHPSAVHAPDGGQP